MQELIKIHKSEIQSEVVNSVNARDLHEKLEIKKHFTQWISAQIKRAELQEDRDYLTINQKVNRQTLKEYILTLDSAKHIAMMSQSKEAKTLRDYFIDVEKKYISSIKGATQDFNPILLEIVKSSQATSEAVVRMGESMQSFTRHFLEMNNEMTRLKSHTRDTLNEMNHTMKNMHIGISAARGDAQQGMQVSEEVLKVVEKLEVYYKRDTLTSTQQQQINKRIDEKARELAAEAGVRSDVAKMSLYIRLKNYFDVPMYSAIKSESFAKALQVIDDHSLTYEECGE